MKDGHTRREHLESAGVDLGIPELPALTAHIWEWFIELANKRTSGAMAANPITWADLRGYFELIGEKPSKFELDALALLDRMSLSDSKKQ